MIHRLFLFAFACLFAAGSAIAQPRADGFEVAESASDLFEFMDEPAQFGYPRLSPSGRYLAYISTLAAASDEEEAQRYLVIVDLDGEGEQQAGCFARRIGTDLVAMGQ